MNNSFYWSDELYHHGTLGQKWGLRRYQNPDGSLTALGRIHYGVGKLKERYAEKKAEKAQRRTEDLERKALRGSNRAMRKARSKMTDEELKQHIARLNAEKQYQELVKSLQGGLGHEARKITGAIVKKALVEAGTDALKKVIGVGTDKLVDSVKNAVNNAKTEDLTPKDAKENSSNKQQKSENKDQKSKQQKADNKEQKSSKQQKIDNKEQKNNKQKDKNKAKDDKPKKEDKKPVGDNKNTKKNSFDKLPENVKDTIRRAHNQSKKVTKEDNFITFGNKVVNLSADRKAAIDFANKAFSSSKRFKDRSGREYVPSSVASRVPEARRFAKGVLIDAGIYDPSRRFK